MDTLLSILKNVAPGIATLVAGPAGGAVVSALAAKFGVSDTVEEVAKAIAGDPAAAQKLAEMDLEKFRIEEAAVTSRWEADMGSDSWLSKNIRPMALIAIFVAFFLFTMMSAFGYNAQESYVQLLGQWGQIIFLAYFGGRTIEKLADMKAKK
jgi:pimeloyl-ACP methyl ester carboxylesterase